jgi:hypothetical protein
MYKLIRIASAVARTSATPLSWLIRLRREGAGRAQASIARTKRAAGLHGMQFNFVVAQYRGVALWKKLGFEIIGTLPRRSARDARGR